VALDENNKSHKKDDDDSKPMKIIAEADMELVPRRWTYR
jgi:hypothetical protein